MPKGHPREQRPARKSPPLDFGRKKGAPRNLQPLTEQEIAAKVANWLLQRGGPTRLPQGNAANTVAPPVHFRVMG